MLKIMGLDEKWEPYLDTGDYIDNMSLWPPVEFAHIFCYFIETWIVHKAATHAVEELGCL